MTRTFQELKEHLATWDELDLVEALKVTSTDLVNAFEDRIEEYFDTLSEDEEELDW